MPRPDGRTPDQLRPVRFALGVQPSPAGSVQVAFGDTTVLLAASVEEGGQRWKDGGGWLTGEYAMLPGSTTDRARRERRGPSGRSKEIERLLGRSLRAAVDLDALPEVTITVDADVLVADGGTRTAAITGGWVAVAAALRSIGAEEAMVEQLAAVSVGVVDGEVVLDLPYVEDSAAEVDMNVVATADGRIVEVQGTAEGAAFSRAQHDRMLDLALAGIDRLCAEQRAVLDG
jgi:ribonuclease PH